MHIVDGALSTPVVLVGAALAAGGLAIGLRKIDADRLPEVGMLSATFFVASLIHVPLGPSSVHLILNGLVGLVLGWAAVPALFVALLLQSVFLGYGGLMVLGVNTVVIAGPAVLVHLLCGPGVRRGGPRSAAIWGGIAGVVSILLTAVFVALALAATGDAFVPAAKLVLAAHVPVMLVEGVLTAAAVVLIRKVNPTLFEPAEPGAPVLEEAEHV